MTSVKKTISIVAENVENYKSDAMVQNTDIFSCGICEQNEENLIDFLKHKLEHQGPGKCYVCQLCHISYTKETSLKQHYKIKHRVALFPRKVNKVCSKEKGQTLPENITKNENDNSSLEMGDVGNINVIDLFNNQGSDNLNNNCDHDYDKTEEEEKAQNSHEVQCNVMDMHEETPVIINSSVPTNTINIGYVELKSNSRLSLCYSDPMALNNSQGILAAEPLGGNVMNENDLVTCNVEIISLDQPNNDLYIDDHSPEQESSEEHMSDEKMEEHDFYFCLQTDLKAGKTVVYNREELMCIYCNFKDICLTNLYEHMCEKHEDQLNVQGVIKLQNNVENLNITRYSEYKSLCFKSRMDSNKKNRNTELQDQAGEFPCSKCDKIFTRLRYLKKHLALHKPEKPYLCDFCGKSFKTRTYLTVHHRSHAKKTFKCEQCDFTSTNTALIRLHRQQHNSGCVLCDVCGNAYSDKSTLTKHKRVHDPSRPYQCNYPGCTWRFMTEVMCRAHQRNHDTEGKFICNHCGYAFRHKHHVKRHEAKVHGIRNRLDSVVERVDSREVVSTVNVVVESTEESLQEAIPGGQLVITTDAEGNALNYHLTDISNVALMASEERTIIIPQIDYGNIVLQRVENADGDSPFIKVTALKDN